MLPAKWWLFCFNFFVNFLLHAPDEGHHSIKTPTKTPEDCHYWVIHLRGTQPMFMFGNHDTFPWSPDGSLPAGWFNIKMSSYQYRKSHYGDKTILRPSYLHNGISYTGKTTSLYWIRALVTKVVMIKQSGRLFHKHFISFFVWTAPADWTVTYSIHIQGASMQIY